MWSLMPIENFRTFTCNFRTKWMVLAVLDTCSSVRISSIRCFSASNKARSIVVPSTNLVVISIGFSSITPRWLWARCMTGSNF